MINRYGKEQANQPIINTLGETVICHAVTQN